MCSITKTVINIEEGSVWAADVSTNWRTQFSPVAGFCHVLQLTEIELSRVTRKLSKVPKFSSVGNVPPSWLHLPAEFVFNLSALRESVQIYGDRLFYKKKFLVHQHCLAPVLDHRIQAPIIFVDVWQQCTNKLFFFCFHAIFFLNKQKEWGK